MTLGKRSLLEGVGLCYCDYKCKYTHETGDSCVCWNAACDCRPY